MCDLHHIIPVMSPRNFRGSHNLWWLVREDLVNEHREVSPAKTLIAPMRRLL